MRTQESRLFDFVTISDDQTLNQLISMDIPIDEIGLTMRTTNILKVGGITTLRKLLNLTKEEVLEVRRLGPTAFTEIKQQISKINNVFVERLLKPVIQSEFKFINNYGSFENLLVDWLSTLNSRTQSIIHGRFGFTSDRVLTLEEISKQFGITRERVRQIEKKALHYLHKPLFYHDLIGYVEGLKEIIKENSGIISYNSFETLVNSKYRFKHLRSIGVIRLIAQLDDSLIRIPEIRAWTLESYPYRDILSSIKILEEILDDEKAPIDWRSLFTKYLDRISIATTEESYLLSAAICASESNDLYLYPDGSWGLKKWQHQIFDDLILVLRKLQQPSHFSEITTILNTALPESEKLSDHNVHSCLGRRPELFVRVGRGTFGLAEWGLENEGSIANTVYRIIKEAGKPLPLDFIVKEVLATWQVQANSIFMAIENDDRFHKIGRKTYCLKEQISNGNDLGNDAGDHIDSLLVEGLIQFQEKVAEQDKKNTPDVFSEFEKLDQLGMDFFSGYGGGIE